MLKKSIIIFILGFIGFQQSFAQSLIVAGHLESHETDFTYITNNTDTNDNTTNTVKATVIQITGAIAYPIASQLSEVLQKNTNSYILLQLNSPGGSVSEGQAIIDLLRATVSKGVRLGASVGNGEVCASMCVPIYAQATDRYAAEVAVFMFHGATQADFTNIPNYFKTHEVLNYFYEAGFSKEWLDNLIKLNVFSSPGSYWITGRELVDQKSNVVTFLTSRQIIEEPWHAPIDPNIQPR